MSTQLDKDNAEQSKWIGFSERRKEFETIYPA